MVMEDNHTSQFSYKVNRDSFCLHKMVTAKQPSSKNKGTYSTKNWLTCTEMTSSIMKIIAPI